MPNNYKESSLAVKVVYNEKRELGFYVHSRHLMVSKFKYKYNFFIENYIANGEKFEYMEHQGEIKYEVGRNYQIKMNLLKTKLDTILS